MWFVSDLVGNPEDQFSHNEAHLVGSLKESFVHIMGVCRSQPVNVFKYIYIDLYKKVAYVRILN